jgi:conjugal transfer pilus assembly protein TraW
MTYIVQEDVKDARGVTIYPKGYKFNPVQYVRLKTSYVVIDATDKAQLEWLKKSDYIGKFGYQVWISDGGYKEVSKELNQSVFYVSQEIADKFKLRRTPSLISQFNDRIIVKEICIDCNISKDKR